MTMKAVLAFFALAASALGSDIYDKGKFFSGDGAERARVALRNVEKESGVEIIIETRGETVIPTNVTKDEFWRKQLREAAAQNKAKGVFILINKKPGRLQVDISDKVKDHFPKDLEKQLVDVALPHLRKHTEPGNDKALEELCAKLSLFAQGPIEAEMPPVKPLPLPGVIEVKQEQKELQDFDSTWVAILIGLLVVIIVAALIVYHLSADSTDVYVEAPPPTAPPFSAPPVYSPYVKKAEDKPEPPPARSAKPKKKSYDKHNDPYSNSYDSGGSSDSGGGDFGGGSGGDF
jgi:uncharacterized membrane protein YgcG